MLQGFRLSSSKKNYFHVLFVNVLYYTHIRWNVRTICVKTTPLNTINRIVTKCRDDGFTLIVVTVSSHKQRMKHQNYGSLTEAKNLFISDKMVIKYLCRLPYAN